MKTVENPYIENVYVFTVLNGKETHLRPRQWASPSACAAVLQELHDKAPDAGPYYIKYEYTGNGWNRVLLGNGSANKPETDIEVKQASVYRFNSEIAHNAGEIYNALTNGYTYPLDEFRAEAAQ